MPVYIAQMQDVPAAPVKVGFSQHTNTRRGKLTAATRVGPGVVGPLRVLSGTTLRDEKQMHRRLTLCGVLPLFFQQSDFMSSREWYAPSNALRANLKEVFGVDDLPCSFASPTEVAALLQEDSHRALVVLTSLFDLAFRHCEGPPWLRPLLGKHLVREGDRVKRRTDVARFAAQERQRLARKYRDNEALQARARVEHGRMQHPSRFVAAAGAGVRVDLPFDVFADLVEKGLI